MIVLLQSPIFLLKLALSEKGFFRPLLGLCNLGAEDLFCIITSSLLQTEVYLADRKLGFQILYLVHQLLSNLPRTEEGRLIARKRLKERRIRTHDKKRNLDRQKKKGIPEVFL